VNTLTPKSTLNFFIKLVLLTFLIIVSLNFSLIAQSKIKNKISYGLDALYNFNFKTAEKNFNDIIKNYPQNSAGYHYKSLSYLWYFLDSKDETDFDYFFAYTDTAIEKAKSILDKDTTDEFTLYILGSVYANRTFAFTREENYFDAVFAASKFYSYFNELLDEDSLYYDAFMGKGLYNFAISQAPQTWSWAIKISGMTGDKKLGLKYLETAAKKGDLSKVDAQFYLSQIYAEFLLKYPEAQRILDNLTFRFPNNLLFQYSLANLYLKKYDLYSASRKYKSIVSSKDTNFLQLKNYAGLALGDIAYSKDEFTTAQEYYKNFLELSIDKHYKGITALKLGLSYLFEGDSISALLFFDITSEGNNDLDEDAFAKVKGRQYLNKLPSKSELKLILIKNLIDAGKFAVAIDSLQDFVQSPVSDTLRAEAILYLSEANYNLGRYKKSREYALAIFNFDDCELWVKPFACYYAARASKELNNIIDAKLFIDYAANFKNYFFENKLRDRLNFLTFMLEEK
jgi:hypothetical protein